MSDPSLRQYLQTAVEQPAASCVGLWARLREKLDLAMYRPQATAGVIASHLTGRDGPYTVLKNPAAKTYYHLSDRDTFLWERMDGTRTVKDLVVAFYGEYGSFAFGRVAGLVSGLRANRFLVDQPVNAYHRVRERLEGRRLRTRLGRLWHSFLQTPLAISGLDDFLGRAYRSVGWLLFTVPAQILYVLLSIAGLVLFGRLFLSGRYSLTSEAGSYGLGLALLIVAQFVAVFLHELSHALAVKHYSREVRRAGMMVYFGMPAFFVDTTDMWLEERRPRLVVTWAGPYSGLILAGLVTGIMTLSPDLPLNSLLFKFAFLCYVLVFMNLNPLLELDGYYLLMDWLGIPHLRRKSLEFLRVGLPARLRRAWVEGRDHTKGAQPKETHPVLRAVRSLSVEERIFVVFGVLATIWTIYAVYAGLAFWQSRLAQAFRELWTGGGASRVALAVLGIAISVLFVAILGMVPLRMVRGWLAAAALRGLFRSLWRVAGLLVAGSALLAFGPGLLGQPIIAQVTGALALPAAAALGWRNARDHAGSRTAVAFYTWSAAALALLLYELIHIAAPLALSHDRIISPSHYLTIALLTFGFLGSAGLLLGSALLFAGTNLRESSAAAKVALGLGVVAGYGLFVALVQRGWQGGDAAAYLALNAVLLPWLAAALLAPVLVAFWGTRAAPAWIGVAVALVGLAAFALAGLPPAFPYLLLASGLYLHHRAYTRSARESQSSGLRYIHAGASQHLHPTASGAVQVSAGSRPAKLESTPDGDANWLYQAFAALASAVHAHLADIAGRSSAAAVTGQFNGYALAAGWRVSLASGQVQDALPADLSLVRRGEAYAAALSTLLDLAAAEMGEPLTVAALRRAFDSLPWEAREVGAQYLFRLMPRAAALSVDFDATSRDYTHLLRGMPLFATMSHDELAALASRLTPARYAAGETIIRQGEAGDRFYIVHQGHVEVRQRDERGISAIVNQLDRGGYFGETALLRDVPRTATCIATVPTTLLCLSRADFERLVRDRFAMHDKLDRSVARAELLRRIPLFAEMDGSQVQHIAAEMREEGYLAGTYLMRQGEVGETFYVIQAGRVEVLVERAGKTGVVAQRGPGEYLGEIALLLAVPRTASVRALAHTRVLALDKAGFDRLMAEQLHMAQTLERETSRRMRDLR